MLTVQVDQVLARFRELRERGRAPVDPSSASTLHVERSAQQQRIAFDEIVLGEIVASICCIVEVELGDDLGTFSTGAQLPRLETVAQEQRQRVEQDRLAGTGLAGENRET